ncbi:undecaprenyl-diphosphate phosphatase [Megasphaera sueciensis]|jgi:undecaprenyl-diphosphatase|uniref:undecaprenyl-diphosphate phosphatase n=1 Tax=Megasphaera sueciensis TaxID=349094 RepID=UPI003D0705CB|nr:undecaprenyl-diphosphate phosphatase [Megasphaera sp.]
MDFLQTVILAIVQGMTELFPISSVAHSVLTPYVFHWQLDNIFLKEHFLPFVVMLHLGTAIALFLFFGSDWTGIVRSIAKKDKQNRKLLYLIIAGSIPAALIGFFLEHALRGIFSSVVNAGFFLMINGCLLYWGEKIRKHGKKEINDLTYKEALIIGAFQSLALIPGFSRSGATITAGFAAGLKHEESVRFSMLLATPIIIGAGILEVPKLMVTGMGDLFWIAVMGGIVSGLAAFFSVWIMMKWFHKNEITAMRPFAFYCWIIGACVLFTSFCL